MVFSGCWLDDPPPGLDFDSGRGCEAKTNNGLPHLQPEGRYSHIAYPYPYSTAPFPKSSCWAATRHPPQDQSMNHSAHHVRPCDSVGMLGRRDEVERMNGTGTVGGGRGEEKKGKGSAQKERKRGSRRRTVLVPNWI